MTPNITISHQVMYNLQDVLLCSLHLVFVPHDHDISSVGAIFDRKLDANLMVITDFVDGGALTANDVRVVLRVNAEGHLEAS